MPLPGQLPYARPAVQAAYEAASRELDHAEREVERTEAPVGTQVDTVAFLTGRLRDAEAALKRAEAGAVAAPEAFETEVAIAKREISYWRDKLTPAEARLAELKAPASAARARAAAARAKLKAIEAAAVPA